MRKSSALGCDQNVTKESGLGLVELMVSITIGLVIMAGVLQLFLTSRENSSTANGASRLQENIRYAMHRIGEDIYRAGNMGCFSFAAVGSPKVAEDDTPDENGNRRIENQYIYNRLYIPDLGGNADEALMQRVVAIVDPDTLATTLSVFSPNVDNGWNDFESSFISGVDNDNADANLLDGTDTLIVKYVDSSAATAITGIPSETQMVVEDRTDLSNNELVIAGNCRGVYVFNIGNIAPGINDTATITIGVLGATPLTHDIDIDHSASFLYAGDTGAYEYSIRTSVGLDAGDECTALTPEYCSLYRSTNGNAQELVLGVSDLQVSYGYEGNAAYQDDIAAVDRLTVDRVRVQMTFNTLDYTQADGLLTRVVTRVFAVRNQL